MSDGLATEGAPSLRIRAFAFGREEFERIRSITRRAAGVTLADSRQELAYGPVARRMRALGLTSFAAYCTLLEGGDSQEVFRLCGELTAGAAAFFREPRQFEWLRTGYLLPRREAGGPGRLRIWCAGCAQGEEAYSIAIVLAEALPEWQGWDIELLATDIDARLLERARLGIYGAESLRTLDAGRLARAFARREDSELGERYTIAPGIGRRVVFRAHNLLDAVPMQAPIDVIFCRNVLVHFDPDVRREVLARMAAAQPQGALLFMSESESLFRVSGEYLAVARGIYRRR